MIALAGTTGAAIVGYYKIFPNIPVSDQIAGSVFDDHKACSKDFPLAAVFKNNSDHVVTKIHFRVKAQLMGRSSDLNEPGQSFVSDEILSPGSEGGICIVKPDLRTPIRDSIVFYTPEISYAEIDDSIVFITPTAPPPPPKRSS